MLVDDQMNRINKALFAPGWVIALAIVALVVQRTEPSIMLAGLASGLIVGMQDRIGSAITIMVASVWFAHFGFVVPASGDWVVLGTLILALFGVPRRLLRIVARLGIVAILFGVALWLAYSIGFFVDSVPLAVAAHILATVIGIAVGQLYAATAMRHAVWRGSSISQTARDILLGRITTGMIHDLAQPMNVVSMANGNLGFLVGQLADDDEHKAQLQERVDRIGGQAEKAAHLLQYFRNFGLQTTDKGDDLTVRESLERAWVSTRSNVKHGGVSVVYRGDALDCVVPEGLGVLQILVAGALLNAYAAFLKDDGSRIDGTVILLTTLRPSMIEVVVRCADSDGNAQMLKKMDPVTQWLLEEVALEAGGSFRTDLRMGRPSMVRIAIQR